MAGIKKTIFINAQWYSRYAKTGIENYIENLCRNIDTSGFNWVIATHSKREQEYLMPNAKWIRSSSVYSSALKRLFWENFILPFILMREKPDIFFSANFSIPLFVPKSMIVIIMIYDLFWMRTNEGFGLFANILSPPRVKYAAKRANRILTISNATKQDVIKFLRIRDDKIKVTYLGLTSSFTKNEKVSPFEERSYFFWVGSFKSTKNITGLCEAYELARGELGVESQLWICGSGGSLQKEILRKYSDSKGIIFKGLVADDGELLRIMKQAKALIYPSLMEGFGLPVLEAMSAGTPVVLSNCTSLPEVAGDAGIYIEPCNIESIASGIARIEKMRKDEWVKLSCKCILQSQNFDYKKTAEETLLVFEKTQ